MLVSTKRSVTNSFPDQRTVLKEFKSKLQWAVTTSWGAEVIIHAQELTFLPLNTPVFVMGIIALVTSVKRPNFPTIGRDILVLR